MRNHLKHLWIVAFVALLSNSVAYARWGVDYSCLQKILIAQISDKPLFDHPVAVIDIGSNTLKLAVQSVDGEVSHFMYPVDLGNSLARNGGVDEEALRSLRIALQRADMNLSEYQMTRKQVDYFATAGIRDAKNKRAILDQLRKEGYSVTVLSEEEEAALVYYSVMRKQKMPPQGAAMIEVGGGSTEIVQGKSLVEIEMSNSRVLPYGSGSIGIKDPFDWSQIEIARKKIREELMKEPVPLISKNRELLVAKSTIFKNFRKIHRELRGKDIFETGFTDEDLQFYLSKDGLAHLKKAHDRISVDGDRGLVANLPSKLLMLQEAKFHYGFPVIKFGSSGGMKAALLDEALAKKVYREFKDAASKFRRLMTKGMDRTLTQFKSLFPEEQFGWWSARVKSVNGSTSKMANGYLSNQFTRGDLKNFSAIQEQVRDGMGARLILEDASLKQRSILYEKLAKGIREKNIVLTEIENYRGREGVPYLRDEDVIELQKLNEQVSGVKPKIVIGKAAEKKSGYTTLQLNTVDSAGRIAEIQFRGKEVQRLFDFDHLIHDIARNKKIPSWAEPIKHDYFSLSKEHQEKYLKYLHDCYRALRLKEVGMFAKTPEIPAGLPQSLKPKF